MMTTALDELRNIANAKRFNREHFADDTEFADWAQSRARAVLASIAPTADVRPDIAEFCELIDDYQCAQIDRNIEEGARLRVALMDAYSSALAQPSAAKDAQPTVEPLTVSQAPTSQYAQGWNDCLRAHQAK